MLKIPVFCRFCLFVCFLFVCFCQRSQRRTFENMKDPFSKPLTWRNICVYFGSISIDTRSFKHVARQPTFVGWWLATIKWNLRTAGFLAPSLTPIWHPDSHAQVPTTGFGLWNQSSGKKKWRLPGCFWGHPWFGWLASESTPGQKASSSMTYDAKTDGAWTLLSMWKS